MTPISSLPEARWEAVQRRDASSDGQFYYGVRSTRVYCRPSCPSRRPRRENVTFFDTPAEAEASGYRACLRCKPTEVSAGQWAVLHVQHLLDTVEPTPGLAALAGAVGLSPFHLQRVFKAATGVSPKGYALARRSERLKAELRTGASVTQALYGAGHPSARTVYDRATDGLGMSPGRYRAGGAGQTIRYAVVESVLGPMLVAATERGLVAVRFGEAEPLTAELRNEYPRATLEEDEAALRGHIEALHKHLTGRRDLALPGDTAGTAFQRRVWDALRGIPYGETRSYAEVAEMIGEPKAVRAVAQACAANPVALVVPCHRVVRTGGAPGGYRWGLERKRELLERERALAQSGT
ncbi:bifunctional DNA-binding transcriptional regulator/O6-methylguanine-DNA methyltransferase Ada [Deinococcus hopiensis]|uniref:Methylated-DNA--protein-cysteine methyltransferase n=1 Tax=Deinococcus hopiensis KR-140 TaxID=695939 RepID=A0A1W1VJH8_9DEIO|nr:bifunctional DNA-binding transcriptional regulator/O6-methylguanine-DNA methyltransferase Ada [Deinococcus hopiensis]SMB93476.1 AraC family transcriptional regulator, regulatory protein of adaptative response / methylated-DNA-[protein]-cysteine methyltransferase [Deinococcus hopiensis KR-140]